MAQEPDPYKRKLTVKIPIVKKKSMQLPILSLQTDVKISKGPKTKQLKSQTKRAQKTSISQLLNILQCPEPTDNYFLMKGNPYKKSRNRENTNRSQQLIDKRIKVQELLHGFKEQSDYSLQTVVQKKEVPSLRNLRLFIQRQRSQNQAIKKQKNKQSQRIYKTLDGVELTSNQVKIVPNHNCNKYLTEQSLQKSLLRKDDLKKEIRGRYRENIRRIGNKSEHRPKILQRQEYLSGWHPLRHRYKSWQVQEVPDHFQFQYFES